MIKHKTIKHYLFILLLGLSVNFTNLLAQINNLPAALNNVATDDSRIGWVKVKKGTNLDAAAFMDVVQKGTSSTEAFDFEEKNNFNDKFGKRHYLYQLKYKGIPVENQFWLIHEQGNRVFLAQGKDYPTIENQATQPAISKNMAINTILTQNATGDRLLYAWKVPALENTIKQVTKNPNASHYPNPELVWEMDKADKKYKLAYKMDIYVADPVSKKRYFINTRTNRVFKTINLITTGCFEDHTSHSSSKLLSKKEKQNKSFADSPATGIANYVSANGGTVNFTSDDNGTNFTLSANNLGPGGNQQILTQSANNQFDYNNITDFFDTDNDWDSEPTAIGAHWGTSQVYEYFLAAHNRNSFDDNGAPLISYVHYGDNYVNAFWNGSNMTYGDGDGQDWSALTSLDVIAHEVMHGITENNGLNGLIYYGESGALNESFSDIFGAIVEYEKHPDGGDWLMGEDFDIANQNGFRNMQDPGAEGHPATYYGNNWYTGLGDNAGVHTNSGVQNFWFYLLTDGGTGTNIYDYTYNVTGIGLQKAAAIAYRNLTTYMNPNATYLDARDGAVQAAEDLYGNSSPEHIATAEAWCAVGLGTICLPTITVNTPILNQILINGTSTDITWSSTMSSIIPFVKIEFTNDVGSNANWSLIADNEPNDGLYNWLIPNIHGTTMRIRVSDAGNPPSRPLGNPAIFGETLHFNILPCSGTSTFTSPAEIILNVPATFKGDVPGDGFEWLINDVSVAMTQDLTHTFTDYGIYTVTYKVLNNTNNCTNIESRTFNVIPDNVCDARLIDINTTYAGQFTAATVQPDEPVPPGGDCDASGYWCSNNLNHTLWYSFVAPATGIVDVRTAGVGFADTRIALYENIDCNLSNPFENANLLDANDNVPTYCCDGSLISRACLAPGNTYHIQVDGTDINQEFTIMVEEVSTVSVPIDESFNFGVYPDDWRWNPGVGHEFGRYYVSDMQGCFEYAPGLRGFGQVATSYFEFPILDFSQSDPLQLLFDYAHVPQNDSVNNELRVEVADGCGNVIVLHTQTGTDLSTNASGTHSNGEFYFTDCSEVKTIQVDLASLAAMDKARLRIAAEGKWLNYLFMDNFLIGEVNDTCRMLDSLVLVDIYNATNGDNWTVPWDLSQPMDTYTGVTLNQFGCVTSVDLDGDLGCLNCSNGGNNLQGNLPNSFGNLFELKTISLSSNSNLVGSLPTSIGNLSKLTNLGCLNTGLGGTLPTEIGSLVNLTNLDLANSQFSGVIPASLNNLTALTFLRVSNNNFSSVPDLSALINLTFLNLGDNPFRGNIPNWIGNLVNLNGLYLYNNQWVGTIPTSFTNLLALDGLSISRNQLSGPLPDLSTLSQLSGLYFNDNNFDGDFPIWMASLPNLVQIDFYDNNFTGVIPNFSNATQLLDINAYNNRFTFESILPHIVANEALIGGNSQVSWQDYDYAPQQKIGLNTSHLLVPGNDYTFDLIIDDTITDNNYNWFKDGNFLQNIVGNNELLITAATAADLGVYTCEVNNPGAPDLTLFSFNYALVATVPPNDGICQAISIDLDQSYIGNLEGASNEMNEPFAPGGDCESAMSWCNTDLHGSVWYSFTPITDTFVSIEVIGLNGANNKIALYEGIDCMMSDPFVNASLIAANDYRPNHCCNSSYIKLACLTAGETYYIQVEQNTPNQEDFTLIVNSLDSCGLECDLNLSFNVSRKETCPGVNDGIIDLYVTSTAGHAIRYDLYNGQNNLINSQTGNSYFTNLSPDDYDVVAQSLDDPNCYMTIDVPLLPAVDTTAPRAFCPSDTVDAAFVYSATGLPWNRPEYITEMDSVFGDAWHQLHYETLNPNLLFSDYYNVIYLEGSSDNATELENFLTTHGTLIENWVAQGNALLLNSAPNEDNGLSFGFGGVQLNFPVFSDSAFAADINHPIFVGPHIPVTDKYGGSFFGHGIVCPASLLASPILLSKQSNHLLVEAEWGSGKVIFGGMSATAFHSPSPEAFNLKINLLEYLKSNADPGSNPTIQLALDETQLASISVAEINVGSIDECQLMGVGLNQTIFNCEDLGFQNIILTATDGSNNIGQCSLQIEIIDPMVYCLEECPDELLVDDVPIIQGTYTAGKISSMGTVAEDSTVIFIAEDSVLLLPNFHATANSDFTAMIGACEPAALVETVKASPRNEEKVKISLSNELKVRPNPFRQSTMIDYELNASQQMRLAVFSMEGKLLSVLKEGYLPEGNYTQELRSEGLRGGMYLVVLQTEKELLTRKIILIE